MRTGWLWFDDDPTTTLEQKVERAAQHYHEKFGIPPNICYVNPQMVDAEGTHCGNIRILPAPHVLRHHFWLGRVTQSSQRKAS